jgi:hypothetical protein
MTDTDLLAGIEPTSELKAETEPDLGQPNACIRCEHWGVQSDVRENDRWRFCMVDPPALAHRDFTCPSHVRIPKQAALARLISKETETNG